MHNAVKRPIKQYTFEFTNQT